VQAEQVLVNPLQIQVIMVQHLSSAHYQHSAEAAEEHILLVTGQQVAMMV
jgi:hypothetical protein